MQTETMWRPRAHQATAVYEGSVARRDTFAHDFEVDLTDKDKVSAGDGKRLATITGIGVERMVQADAAMRYLNRHLSVPTAFKRRSGGRMITAEWGEMMSREVVVRLAAMGSYLERHPDEEQRWFERPIVEFFHKKTLDQRGACPVLRDGNDLRRELGIDAFLDLVKQEQLVPDPYVVHNGVIMEFYHPHKPLGTAEPLMAVEQDLDDDLLAQVTIMVMEATLLLDEGLKCIDIAALGVPGLTSVRLGDIKWELAHRKRDGQLVIADLVNLDCLRMLKNGSFEKGAHLSKQRFRDGDKEEDVLEVYKLGTRIFQLLNTLP